MLYLLKQSKRSRGIIALILLSVFFASAGVFVRELQKSLHLFQQIYLQSLISFAAGTLIFRKHFKFNAYSKLDIRECGVFFVRAFAWYILGAALYNRALLYTQVASAAFLGALPFCGVWGFLFFGEKFSARKWILVGVSFMGVLLIAVPSLNSIFTWGKGELLACIASIAFSFGLTSRAWHAPRFSDLEISQIYLSFGILVGVLMAFFVGEPFELSNVAPVLPLMLFWGAMISVSAVMASFAYSNVEASTAGNILTLECPMAVLFGYVFFGEVPGIKVILGGVLIMASATLLGRGENQSKT